MASLVYSPKSSKDYGLLIAFIFFSAIVGLVAAFGNVKADLIIVGMAFGYTVLLIPLGLVYWGMAILCFLVVGQLEYFARITAANWLPPVIGFVFYFRIPLEYLKSLRDRNALPQRSPSVVIPVYLFLVIFVVSSVYNMSPAMQLLVGFKTYLPYFSFLFVLLINYNMTVDLLNKIWRKFFIVAIIQLPLLLYQYFFIKPMRSNAGGRFGTSDDAMVGGFGGDPMGGGGSGALVYSMVLVLTLTLIMWKNKETNIVSLTFIAIFVLLAILLAEVKIVIIFIPVMLLLVYRREVIKNPVYFIFLSTIIFGFMIAILLLYSNLHNTVNKSRDLAGMFDDTFGYVLDPNYSKLAGKTELGRRESIT